MNPLDELTYDPITGFFHWSVTRARCRYGARAGSLNTHGYLEIGVHGRRYMAHRLVWLLKYGVMPSGEIDHINGDRADNRICNLRLATRKQNAANMRGYASSGFKGAYYDKRRSKWFSAIGKTFLGYFQSPEDAHAAYCMEAQERYGEFATSGNHAPLARTRNRRHGDARQSSKIVAARNPRNDRTPLEDRFWQHVFPEPNSGCWLWVGYTNKGYGFISTGGYGGGLKAAHRLSWELHKGPIADGYLVCHRCDVRCCVNPEHLFIGTQLDNIRDMYSKGRARNVSYKLRGKPRPGRVFQSEKTHCKSGHPLSGDNLSIASNGWRNCRACWRVRRAKSQAKKRVAITRDRAGRLSLREIT